MKSDSLLYQNPNRAADRFLSAFLSILKQENYKDITITQLCQEAQLSRKTFYENFKNKDDLLDYFVNAGCIAYPRAENNLEPNLHYFKFWYAMREWVQVFIENDLWYQINAMTLQHYIPLLSHRNWNNLLGKQIKNQELIFYFFNAGYSEIIKKWAFNDFKESPEELAEMVKLIISEKFTTT